MKKRSTILVALLSLVCLVCGAIGLAACGDDKEVVIKVGETKISTVDATGATYKVEGDVDKEYVLTVKSKDAVCETVHISMPESAEYSQGSYGTMTFKYFNGAAVKLVSETTVKNVTVVMEEKTYAQGDAKNPIAIEINKDVNYSVGFDYVFYAVSVSTEGTYEINLTGTDADKVAVVYSCTLDDDGEYVLDEATTFTFEKDVTYVVGVASNKFDNDGNAVTVTGTFKIAEYLPPQPVNKGALTAAAPVTCDSIDAVGVNVTIQAEANKIYTVTAKKDGQTCTAVSVFAGANAQGNGEATFASNQAEAVTVRIRSLTETAVTNVTIELTVTEPKSYTEITAGTMVTNTVKGDEQYVIYQIALTEGTYQITGDINLGDPTNIDWPYGDIEIGTLDGEEINMLNVAGSDEFTVAEAGTYYVKVWTEDTFKISAKD